MAAMFGGVALFAVSLSAFRRRTMGQFNRSRLVLAGILIAFVPLGAEIPAIAALTLLAGTLVAYLVYEVRATGDNRSRIRTELRH